MQSKFKISKIITFSEIDSTNKYVKKLLNQNDFIDGMVVFADYQSQGTGQRGHFWESNAGENLLMSLLLIPENFDISRQFNLNMMISISIVELLAELKLKAYIKWPNDIIVNHNKVAGILIENTLTGNKLSSCIIGIGLNVNQEEFSENFSAISIKKLIGNPINIVELKNVFLKILEKNINLLYTMDSISINSKYQSHLYGYGELIQFNKGDTVITAKIAGVDEYGRIILEEDGSKNAYQHGEVRQKLT
jgi:BirA family biotin operon repressor/biotin-[acetyl-CoA-carboxylase] ligase